MLCQREEREAGRAYPRTCPTCKLGPCQKFGAKPLQSLADAQAEIDRLTRENENLRQIERNVQAAREHEHQRAKRALADAARLREQMNDREYD